VVKNVSETPVEISRIQTTCGCITPVIKGYVAQPGETFSIPIEFNSKGYGGTKVEKDVFVFTADSKKPALALKVSASVKGLPPSERISVEPMDLSMVNSTKVERAVSILSPSDKNIQIDVTGPPWLACNLTKVGTDELRQLSKWSLTLRLKQEVADIDRGSVIIRSNLAGFEQINVSVEIQPAYVMSVTPPVLFPKAINADFMSASFSLRLYRDDLDKLFDYNDEDVRIIPSAEQIKIEKLNSRDNGIDVSVSMPNTLKGMHYLFVFLGDRKLGEIPIILE